MKYEMNMGIFWYVMLLTPVECHSLHALHFHYHHTKQLSFSSFAHHPEQHQLTASNQNKSQYIKMSAPFSERDAPEARAAAAVEEEEETEYVQSYCNFICPKMTEMQ